jgi:hypothetical protein
VIVMRPHRTALVVALGAAALLGGCSSSAPGTDATSTVTVTETGAGLSPDRQQLTAAEVTRAVSKDAPTGFLLDPGGADPAQDPDSQRTTDPASCLALYLDTPQMRTFADEHVTAADRARYSDSGDGIGTLLVTLWTHDERYPTRFLDEAGAALADCSGFSATFRPGEARSPYRATTIAVPQIGDQSFGVRIGSPGGGVTVDELWVANGHNLVHVRMVSDYHQDNAPLLDKTARGVLEGLGG